MFTKMKFVQIWRSMHKSSNNSEYVMCKFKKKSQITFFRFYDFFFSIFCHFIFSFFIFKIKEESNFSSLNKQLRVFTTMAEIKISKINISKII